MQNTIIIETNKDGAYKGVSFSERVSDEEAVKLAADENLKAGFCRYHVVRDKLIVDAIRAKEDSRTMKFYAKRIKEQITDLMNEVNDRVSSLECYNDTLKEFIEEEKAGAN